MSDEKIWNLIGRQLSGEANREELILIDTWKNSHPDNQIVYQKICEYWNHQHKPYPNNARQVWDSLEQQISKKDFEIASSNNSKEKKVKWWPLKVAAVITILVLAGWSAFYYGDLAIDNLTSTVVENPRGTKSKIVLPDGSQVWLNAESKLVYHQDFGQLNREVYLSGEAFFDVERNPDLPFIIQLDNSHIQVLGTSFNVRSYDDDEIVETSVVTGEVMFVEKILGETNGSIHYITPNHKLAFSKRTGHIEKIEVDSQENMAWTQGRFIFKNATWAEIAKTLERTFNTDIEFENESIKNCHITATFNEKTLKEILEMIAMTQEFDYEIDQGVMIKGQGCPL
jgi:ferric-dicitrate binding protein FerR (iron transport regulator)